MKNLHLTSLLTVAALATSQAVLAGSSCGQQGATHTPSYSYVAPRPTPITKNPSRVIYERVYYDDGTSELVALEPVIKVVRQPVKTLVPNVANNNSELTFLPPTNQNTNVIQSAVAKNNAPTFDEFRTNGSNNSNLAAPHSPTVHTLNGISIDTGQ